MRTRVRPCGSLCSRVSFKPRVCTSELPVVQTRLSSVELAHGLGGFGASPAGAAAGAVAGAGAGAPVAVAGVAGGGVVPWASTGEAPSARRASQRPLDPTVVRPLMLLPPKRGG